MQPQESLFPLACIRAEVLLICQLIETALLNLVNFSRTPGRN